MKNTKKKAEDGFRVVAITGRSGSGKSTVSAHYAEKGYPVLDADAAARMVVQPGSPCLARLVEAFGQDILDDSGALRRQRLAARAFATEEGTRRLTEITHPAIIAYLLEGVRQAREGGAPLVFVDGAVIVGGLFEPYCDAFIVVTTPERDAISRIVLRDGISKQAAHDRLDAQTPEETLRAAADYLIENNHTQQALLQQADAVLNCLLSGNVEADTKKEEYGTLL